MKQGFTLIELLVVLAIIVLLAALLGPNISRMLDGGKSAQCLANLKSLGVAFNSYCADHDGKTPFVEKYGGYYGSAQVFSLLLPYESNRKTYQCPSDNRQIPNVPVDDPDILKNRVSYAANDLITGNYRTAARSGGVNRLVQIQQAPSKIVLFFDTDLIHSRFMTIGEALGTSVFDPNNSCPSKSRHRGGANFLFMDGHTAWLQTSKYPAKAGPNYPDSTNVQATFSPLLK